MASTTGDAAPPAMTYRLLGRSGLKVSTLSLGSWVTFKYQVDTNPAYELMRAAYKRGVNFFDNAETYAAGEAERIMGEAVHLGIQNGDWKREDLVVSTKIFFGTRSGVNNVGLSRKHIVEGTRASLKRLQLEYVDLIFCHRPDPLTPMEEIVRAMNWVIDQGWAFYWGTSEWSAAQLMEAAGIADRLNLIRPLMEQPEYNLFARERLEREYLTVFSSLGLGTTIWSPLASGILTGKYSGGEVPDGSRLSLKEYKWLRDLKLAKMDQIERTDRLKPIADRLQCSLAQLAIAWCLLNPNVTTVILGATSLKQLEENLDAMAIVPKLTADVVAEIEAIVESKPVPDRVTTQVMNMRK